MWLEQGKQGRVLENKPNQYGVGQIIYGFEGLWCLLWATEEAMEGLGQ